MLKQAIAQNIRLNQHHDVASDEDYDDFDDSDDSDNDDNDEKDDGDDANEDSFTNVGAFD